MGSDRRPGLSEGSDPTGTEACGYELNGNPGVLHARLSKIMQLKVERVDPNPLV
jgi:hypothetical protein